MHLQNPDLSADPQARFAVKDETVQVEFAAAAGTLTSAVGLNRYQPGDALITGSTGDRWCVSRGPLPEPPGAGARETNGLPLLGGAHRRRGRAARCPRGLARAVRAGRPWHR